MSHWKGQGQRDAFRCAGQGLKYAWQEEGHFRFHLCFALLVVILGWLLQLGVGEWIAIFLAIALVLLAELCNTAIEAVVDLITLEYHPLAKKAKDISAGAVVVSVCAALVIGALVFLPKLWQLVQYWF